MNLFPMVLLSQLFPVLQIMSVAKLANTFKRPYGSNSAANHDNLIRPNGNGNLPKDA